MATNNLEERFNKVASLEDRFNKIAERPEKSLGQRLDEYVIGGLQEWQRQAHQKTLSEQPVETRAPEEIYQQPQQPSIASQLLSGVVEQATEINPYTKAIKDALKLRPEQPKQELPQITDLSGLTWYRHPDGKWYKETPSGQAGQQTLGRPLVDPIDLIGGAAFGAKMGVNMGLRGLPLAREIGREAVSEVTMGGSDIATGLARGIGRKLTQKEIARVAESQEFINNYLGKRIGKTEYIPIQAETRKVFDADVDEVIKQFQKDENELKQLKKFKWKDLKEKLNVRFIDDTANVRASLTKVGKDITKKLKSGTLSPEEIEDFVGIQKSAENAIVKRALIRGTSANAVKTLDDVDRTIFKGMSQTDINDLNRMRESLRTVELGNRGIKSPGGLSSEKHLKYLKDLQQSDPQRFEQLYRKSQQIQDVYNNQLRQLVDNGLISQQSYDNILAKGSHYNPRRFIQYIDPGTETIRNGRKVTVGDSGIPYLKEGSEKALEKDSRVLLQEYTARIQSRISRNNANKALYDFAQRMPDNEIVKIFEGDRIPGGYDAVNVMINGQKKRMIMPVKMAEEWKGLDPIFTRQQAHMISLLSGNKLLKAFATGINPIFAVRNLARDIGYVYMSPEYAGFIPRFTAQIANDYRKTLKDAVLKKGAYLDYIREGGGMETLTRQGRLFDKHFKKTQDVLGALGDFSERWTRLAHRNRAIVNGKSPEVATFLARDALDFSQGGTWAKAADTVVPYLNAGIQGTRGMIKFARKDPKLFAWKLTNLAGVSAGLYMYNTYNYKDDYDKIPSRDKANNWIIMTPLTYKDKDGEQQRWGIRIPKDQSQRIFTSIFENAVSKIKDNEVDTEQISLANKDFLSLLPTGESYMPPLMKASIGYSLNKDLWRNEDIWRGEEVNPELEFTKYTPEVYKSFGELAGLSPQRSQYAAQQFFTTNNTFTNYFGLGLDQIMKTMNSDEQVATSEDLIRNTPLLRAFLVGTSGDHKFQQEAKEIKREVTSENVKLKRSQDRLFRALEQNSSQKNINLMNAWIRMQPNLRKEYLENRFKKFMEVKDIDRKNWRWWMDLAYEKNKKAQAMIFNNRWKKLDKAGKRDLENKLGRLDATSQFSFGNKFWAEFNQIKE